MSLLKRIWARLRPITGTPTCSRDACLEAAAGLSHLCRRHALDVLNELDKLDPLIYRDLPPETLAEVKMKNRLAKLDIAARLRL